MSLVEVSYMLLGFILGLAFCIVYLIYLGHKAYKESEKTAQSFLDSLKAKADSLKKDDDIKSRMTRVRELTEQQLELQSQATMPQKNSLHGKYQNDLIGKIKSLEEEKTEILKSIISDGHDPEITTMDEYGSIEKQKLSEFLANSGIVMDSVKTENNVPPTQDDNAPKQIGKFTVYKGGKDDGRSH